MSGTRNPKPGRVTNDRRARILQVLAEAGEPMRRGDISKKIPNTSWEMLRYDMRALLKAGKINRLNVEGHNAVRYTKAEVKGKANG